MIRTSFRGTRPPDATEGFLESGTTPWFTIASALLLIIAAAMRFRSLDATLFEDEVWVAELVRAGGWRPHSYATPPLFYGLCRLWTSVRGFSDAALREPAALFGVALCVVPFLAPIPRLARLLWSAMLAFSSPLLFYSTRLKQYTLEAFFTALLIVVFLRYWDTRSRRTAVVFFLIAAVAVTSLYSPVLVLGGLAIVCFRRPQMLLGFALVFALWALAYLAWLSPGPESTVLHGDMDTYFALNGRWIASPSLAVSNTLHWIGQSLNLVRWWWLALPAVVLLWAWRERDPLLSVIGIVPPLLVAVASVLHYYPYGEVRLMIFALPGLFLIPSVAISALTQRQALFVLLIVPFVWSGAVRDSYNDTYMQISDLREMYSAIERSRSPRELIYADPSFAVPLRYHHPGLAPQIRSVALRTATGPGWYLQRADRFRIPEGALVIREGSEVAVRLLPEPRLMK